MSGTLKLRVTTEFHDRNVSKKTQTSSNIRNNRDFGNWRQQGPNPKKNKCVTSITDHRILSKIGSIYLAQDNIPETNADIKYLHVEYPTNIKLADPHFDKPEEIDFLIGAEIYHQLMSVGQISLGKDLPILQNTLLGWIMAGKIADKAQPWATCGISTEEEVDQDMEKFWKVEEVEANKRNFSPEEKACDSHFNQNTVRNAEGRFVVRLPFKATADNLGESRDIALQRFLSLERKLTKNDDLRRQYVSFMEEYIDRGHMERLESTKLAKPYYFLPHHCVLRPDSTTTRLRVVFDGSAKTSSDLSLNDVLATGPTIQDDLLSILLRFRLPRYVFTADIEKMYRQVLVHEQDRRYQLIFWRDDPSKDLQVYQLNTVTYGTTSAPFLATKCLQKLAMEESNRYPLGAKALSRDFYMDDVMSGANTLHEAMEIQTQLNIILSTAGLRLRKWCANHTNLLQNIPPTDIALRLDLNEDEEERVHTLGLTWIPKSDEFSIKARPIEGRRVTKRSAYSDIAHLYDPLGFLGPVIVTAKIFLQRLWSLRLEWDAALPQELHSEWIKFREGLKHLHEITIPRHVFSHKIPKTVQIHAFADASEKAYGAAIYIRAVNNDNVVTVRLLCAKSRVAPVKKLTLPRLELCAAKLAAELATRVEQDLRLKNSTSYL